MYTQSPTTSREITVHRGTTLSLNRKDSHKRVGPQRPLWRKRETVIHERIVEYTTVDADGVTQELIESERSQNEIVHLECKETGEFAHREYQQFEQLETFNNEIVAHETGNEVYVHMKSKDDEYEHLESNMPTKMAERTPEEEEAARAEAEAQAHAAAGGGYDPATGMPYFNPTPPFDPNDPNVSEEEKQWWEAQKKYHDEMMMMQQQQQQHEEEEARGGGGAGGEGGRHEYKEGYDDPRSPSSQDAFDDDAQRWWDEQQLKQEQEEETRRRRGGGGGAQGGQGEGIASIPPSASQVELDEDAQRWWSDQQKKQQQQQQQRAFGGSSAHQTNPTSPSPLKFPSSVGFGGPEDISSHHGTPMSPYEDPAYHKPNENGAEKENEWWPRPRPNSNVNVEQPQT
jgi:hypothetical protein